MRTRTKTGIVFVLTWVLMIGLWLLAVISLQQFSQAQICVADPIVPGTNQAERQPLREKVETWVREKGFEISCPAPLELVVEPLAGKVYQDQIYFVATTVEFENTTLGTVSLRQWESSFQSWMVTIYPRGKTLLGAYTLGHSLHGGVNKMLRKVR